MHAHPRPRRIESCYELTCHSCEQEVIVAVRSVVRSIAQCACGGRLEIKWSEPIEQ